VTYAKSGLFWSQCFLPSLIIRKAQAGAGKSSLGLLCFMLFLRDFCVVHQSCSVSCILSVKWMDLIWDVRLINMIVKANKKILTIQ
jgi:hypothetical protein